MVIQHVPIALITVRRSTNIIMLILIIIKSIFVKRHTVVTSEALK